MNMSGSDSEKEVNPQSESYLKQPLITVADSPVSMETVPDGDKQEGSSLKDITEGSLLSAVMADMSKQCPQGRREQRGRKQAQQRALRRGAKKRHRREVVGARRPTLLEKVQHGSVHGFV